LYWLRNKSHWPLASAKVKKQKKTTRKRLPIALDSIYIPTIRAQETVSDTESESTPQSVLDVAEILFDLGKQSPKKEVEVKNSSDDEKKSCSHCSTEDTPLWRKGPNGDRLCNRW
jgi:hypothetical protein